jgi:hypothetical protein
MKANHMLIDPHSRLKADLYSTADDALVVAHGSFDLPFRLIIWGRAISYDEAGARVQRHGRPDYDYRICRNPTTSHVSLASVSVIETDDPDAAGTIGRGLIAHCYRLLTLDAAQREADRWRASYAYRLVRRTRTPSEDAFAHLLEGDEAIIRNVGYEPDMPRWPLSSHAEDTVHAICLNDPVLATLFVLTIGDFDLQGRGAA